MSVQAPEILEEALIAHFDSLQAAGSGDIPARRKALDHFLQTGLPGMKNEDWKYTNIKKVFRDILPATQPGSKADIPVSIPAEAALLVYTDGFFDEALSRINAPDGVSIEILNSLNDNDLGVIKSTDALTAVHHAFSPAKLFISSGKDAPQTIYILHFLSGKNQISHPFLAIDVAANASVAIAEFAFSADNGLAAGNAYTTIRIGENASCRYVKLQDLDAEKSWIDTTEAFVAKNARFYTHVFSFDCNVIRNNLRITMNGEGGEAWLNGLYLPKGNGHIDNNTLVDHAVPHCYSNELYKGILPDLTTGVFNGKIIVRPDAQKTNAFQSNRNILLSDGANIYAKPQLEIFADDVKCSHGATSSRLDPAETFYLQSRGIGKEKAEALLTFAYADETLEGITDEHLKRIIEEKIAQKLGIEI